MESATLGCWISPYPSPLPKWFTHSTPGEAVFHFVGHVVHRLERVVIRASDDVAEVFQPISDEQTRIVTLLGQGLSGRRTFVCRHQ